MKYILKHTAQIGRKLRSSGFVLLLDFDLTLSPLAKNPNHACLPPDVKQLIKKITKFIPVAIITGRSIADIKHRVGIRSLIYVGNHGLEHSLNKNDGTKIKIPASGQQALLRAKKQLIKINKRYPEIIFENKKYSIALGYRFLKPINIKSLQLLFRKLQNEINKEGLLETRLDKKTFEVRLKTNINKGTACLLILKNLQNKFQKKLTPIYIGDGKTDEDAFMALKENGVTIRVGDNKKSSAEWYLRNQREVILCLRWLLSLCLK